MEQDKVPEAVASISYTLTSPEGYPCILTVRASSQSGLVKAIDEITKYLKDSGYNGGKKEPEKVDGKECPKCGSPLVKVEYRDKKTGETKYLIRCSTQKYDFKTKTTSGCDYVEFPSEDLDSSVDKASPAQQKLLMEKGLWEEGMTKTQATEVIRKALAK